jgi:hypothetical protein
VPLRKYSDFFALALVMAGYSRHVMHVLTHSITELVGCRSGLSGSRSGAQMYKQTPEQERQASQHAPQDILVLPCSASP